MFRGTPCNFVWLQDIDLLYFVQYKTKTKKFADFIIFFRAFSKFFKNKKLLTQIFKILIIHKPSLGSREVPQKFGPDRFSRFDVYWIQTNRQAKFIYR